MSTGVFASAPAEHRGLPRDAVRLMVARSPDTSINSSTLRHRRFADLAEELNPGDVLVVNDSQTVASGVAGRRRSSGAPVVVHVGSRLDRGDSSLAATPSAGGHVVVELRSWPEATTPVWDVEVGEWVEIGAANDGDPARTSGSGPVTLEIVGAYPAPSSHPRLWRARVHGDLETVLRQAGHPIAYGYLEASFPLADYLTIFGARPGSAEIPSAARPFTPELVARLRQAGVLFAPVTLHTSLSSQEAGELPQAEWFEVCSRTAATVMAAKVRGSRVVAVGTTATRALESAVDREHQVVANSGWTTRIVSPERPAVVVDGLISGWHDAEASHKLLLQAVAGAELCARAYLEAYRRGYLWHEFGDSVLFLPPLRPSGARSASG